MSTPNLPLRPEASVSLTLSVRQPCGCLVQHSVSHISESAPAGAAKGLAHYLDFWMENGGAARHRCALVSEENPNGLAPREALEAPHAR